MLHHRGRETKAVVRLSEAWIIAARQQLINGRAVAIGRIQVSEGIPTQAEGVHLTKGVLLDARAVDAHAVGVTGIHFDLRAVLAAHGGIIIETVGRVQPAIEAAPEGRVHAVRVAFPTQWAKEDLA